MSNKRDVVLYLDKDLVSKTRELGFNLSKTFEYTLKQLVNTYSNVNSLNNSEDSIIQGCWWAGLGARGTLTVDRLSLSKTIARAVSCCSPRFPDGFNFTV
jgi:hypothetical protein